MTLDPLITNPASSDPAPPTPILDLTADRHAQLAAFLRNPPDILDVDYVHDLRVITRRVTEVVRLIEPILDPTIVLGISGALRELRQAAAELRDLDVLAEHLAKWRLPHPLRLVAADIQSAIPERRTALATQLRQTCTSTSMQAMLMLLARVIDDQRLPGRGPTVEAKLTELLRKRLRRRRDQMEKAFGRAAHKQTDKSLHEARITVKKFRYSLEIAHAAGFRGTRAALKTLKRLQELLGKHHDVSVITQTLQEHLTTTTGDAPLSSAQRSKRVAAWRTWLRQTQRVQALRAAEFFLQTYLWRNSTIRESAAPRHSPNPERA